MFIAVSKQLITRSKNKTFAELQHIKYRSLIQALRAFLKEISYILKPATELNCSSSIEIFVNLGENSGRHSSNSVYEAEV